MPWPNQNQPTSTLRYRLTADYWASDPEKCNIAKCTFLTVFAHMGMYGAEVLLPCVGPSVGAYTPVPVES